MLLDTLMPLVTVGVVEHLLEENYILQPVCHPGVCRQTISTCAAGFLIVGFQRLRQVQVRNETHVRLVDAHAERNGCHHDQAFLIKKALLVKGP